MSQEHHEEPRPTGELRIIPPAIAMFAALFILTECVGDRNPFNGQLTLTTEQSAE